MRSLAQTGRLSLLGVAALLLRPGLAGAADLRPNLVYATVGGQALKLDACVPSGPGPFAGAILVHGGGWTTGDKRVNFAPLFDPLTRAGIAWFAINYRLAPQYRYPACVDDVETAIRWVKAHAADFNVDPRRIALLGESAGGEIVEMAAVQGGPDTRLAAVVSFYGPCDLEAEARQRGHLSASMIALFGRPTIDAQTEAALREASPVDFVHPGLPPFLLVHGTADRIVPYASSMEFQAKLRAAGDACDFFTVAGGLHSMGNWKKIVPHYQGEVVQWLVRTLHAKAGAIPAIARQGL